MKLKVSWATIRSILYRRIDVLGSRRPGSPRAKRGPTWLKILPLCFFAVVILTFAVWRLCLGFQIQSRLKTIAQKGEPVDAAALNTTYANVPEAENAANVWEQGFQRLVPPLRKSVGSPWSKLTLPPRGTALSNGVLNAAEGLVRSNRVALTTFRQAASLSKARYPVDFTRDLSFEMPHLSRLRSAADLLRLEALVASQTGDSSAALSAILTILAAGHSLDTEPTDISMLFRCAIDKVAYRATERLLNQVNLTESELQCLAAAFERIDDTETLHRVLIGERALLTTMLSQPDWVMSTTDEGEEKSASEKAISWGLTRASGFFQRELRFSLDAFNKMITSARHPDPERFQTRAKWDEIEKEADKGVYFLTSFLPASSTLSQDAEHRARARIAQTALAIERYRFEHNGTLPEKLSALTPELSSAAMQDPFDGQLLRYKPNPRGYIVYSIGPDATDDNGAERTSKRDKGPEDIVFVVERSQ